MKVIGCIRFPDIYCSISGGGGVSLPWIYVYSAIYETVFGVVVFQRSMLNWRWGRGSVCHEYMYILLCRKLIWCSGFSRDLCSIGEGAVGPVYHGYMCVLLFMKLILV